MVDSVFKRFMIFTGDNNFILQEFRTIISLTEIMPWKCCVPHCLSGYPSNKSTRHVSCHRFPNDVNLWRKWPEKIHRKDFDQHHMQGCVPCIFIILTLWKTELMLESKENIHEDCWSLHLLFVLQYQVNFLIFLLICRQKIKYHDLQTLQQDRHENEILKYEEDVNSYFQEDKVDNLSSLFEKLQTYM